MLPPELQQAIEQSYKSVQRHSQHALLPGYRRAIYSALGPPDNSVTQYRRGTLAGITARWVLPIWQEGWTTYLKTQPAWMQTLPDDFPFPDYLLDMAMTVLHRASDDELARAESKFAPYRNMLDSGGIESLGLNSEATDAWLAAYEALFEALGSYRLSREPEPYEEIDEESDANIDPWSGDTARWAVNAYAGEVLEEASNPAKRKEFWEWWLREAIPAAWEAGYARPNSEKDSTP